MRCAGCAQIWVNYINRPLPPGGNGYGAPPRGSEETQGALGLGQQVSVSFFGFVLLLFCQNATLLVHS